MLLVFLGGVAVGMIATIVVEAIISQNFLDLD